MILKAGTPIPEIVRSHTVWLEHPLETDGSGLLVHFWAMSCPACHDNMSHLQKLRQRYASDGLNVVAVHMPRGAFDLDEEQVKQVADRLGIGEPCALDNEHSIGDTFGVNAWPTYFLFDSAGKLRRRALGNFGVRMIEQALIQQYGKKEEEKA